MSCQCSWLCLSSPVVMSGVEDLRKRLCRPLPSEYNCVMSAGLGRVKGGLRWIITKCLASGFGQGNHSLAPLRREHLSIVFLIIPKTHSKGACSKVWPPCWPGTKSSGDSVPSDRKKHLIAVQRASILGLVFFTEREWKPLSSPKGDNERGTHFQGSRFQCFKSLSAMLQLAPRHKLSPY